jgi:hypothetical protein
MFLIPSCERHSSLSELSARTSSHHADPALLGILLSALGPYNNDLHLSNLTKMSLTTRNKEHSLGSWCRLQPRRLRSASSPTCAYPRQFYQGSARRGARPLALHSSGREDYGQHVTWHGASMADAWAARDALHDVVAELRSSSVSDKTMCNTAQPPMLGMAFTHSSDSTSTPAPCSERMTGIGSFLPSDPTCKITPSTQGQSPSSSRYMELVARTMPIFAPFVLARR